MVTLTEQIDDKKLNLVFTDERPTDWAHDKHYVKLKCPCCKKGWWQGYDDSDFWSNNRFTKERALWEICKELVLHVCCQVRFQGDIPHMKLLIDLFGKKKGKELLKKYAKKSIIVARNISLFLKYMEKKQIKNENKKRKSLDKY